MSPERAASRFRRLARLLLPASFVAEFGDELESAFRDRYARTRRQGGPAAWLGFWRSEIVGLLSTAAHSRLAGRSAPAPALPSRDRTSLPPLEVVSTMRQDLVYSLRMIVRTPIVSLIAVASLALALSATIAMYALMSQWLLRPLPYPDSERLVNVFMTDRNLSVFNTLNVAPGDYFDYREQTDGFEWLMPIDFRSINLTGIEEPEELTVADLMPRMLRELGAEPLVGRLFTEEEAVEGADPVVLVREALWRNRFGADPDFVGSTVRLDGAPYTVVGVLPETFDFLLGTVNLWMPTDFESRREMRGTERVRVIGKLRPDVTLQQAEEQVVAVTERIELEHPDTNRNRGAYLQPMREEFPGESDTALIQALLLVAVAALVIACFNVAGLYLAKTDLRAREIAVRTAMGAGKPRLLRLLLTESVLLAMAAGAIGMGLAVFAIRGISTALPPDMPRMYTPTMDSSVVVFGLVISAIAGIVFGISPALQVIRSDRGRSMLLETSRGGSATRARKRLRAALVAGEFALALAILMSAGVMVDVFEGWLGSDTGFDREGLLTAQITLPEYRYGDDEQRRRFLDEVGAELQALPGSTGWAATTDLPRGRGWRQIPVVIEGSGLDAQDAPRASTSSVTPNFFPLLGIEAVRGRLLQEGDRDDTVPVAVVNRRFQEVVFDGRDPVGERIEFRDETIEIVGVIPDFAQFREQGLMPAVPWVYRPLQQATVRQFFLAVKTEAEPATLTAPLRAAVWKIDPDQPISSIQSLSEFIDMTLSGPAYVGKLMYQLGALALALALMGIYGVVAFTVSQQTREIGIRLALGEQTAAVMRGVLRHGAVLAGIGMLIGLPLAFGLLRLFGAALSSLDVNSAIRPLPMAGTAVALAVAAVVACYLPARRAMQVDPVVALQEE